MIPLHPLPLAAFFGTGTLIGLGIALLFIAAFAWSFLKCLDATNGINRNRKDNDSDV